MARDHQPAQTQHPRHAFAVPFWNGVGVVARRQAFVRGQEVFRERGRQAARHSHPVASQRLREIRDGPALCNAKPDILVLAVLLALRKVDVAIAQDAPRYHHRRGAEENAVGPDLEEPLDALRPGAGLNAP